MNKYYVLKIFGQGLFLGLCLYLGMMFMLDSAVLPAYADLELPPRPEPQPVTVEPSVTGATIKLVVPTPLTGDEWTIVQWQDRSTKKWHDADGWRGGLDADGTRTWWVGRELHEKTGFRWLVYAEEGGKLLYTSSEFDMPTHKKELVTVTISADKGN